MPIGLTLAGLAGGVLGGGLSALGAANLPRARYKPAQDVWRNLGAANIGFPAQASLSSGLGPAYTAGALGRTSTALRGTVGGMQNFRRATSGLGPNTTYEDTSVYVPESTGLLDLYQQAQERLLPSYFGAATAGRAGLPEGSLYDSIQSSAQEGLDLGGDLDPVEARRISQGVLGKRAAVGQGRGGIDKLAQALALAMRSQELRQSRQQFALGAGGLLGQSSANLMQLGGVGERAVGGAVGLGGAEDPFENFNLYGQLGQGRYRPDPNSAAAAMLAAGSSLGNMGSSRGGGSTGGLF